jgi:outer membrane receptor for ferric coprogen and ferric-rhodotorulic acid
MKKHATPKCRCSVGKSSRRTLLFSSVLLSTPLALLAQQAPKPSSQPEPATATPAPSEVAARPTNSDEEVVILSPFEVVGETRGYQATNTMSGTRFNTKLEDLASSITVMTKNQMSDFAMLDLNDVFLYVAGTEGTGTYTDYGLDRNGSISDNVQINPTAANRVRGLAPANVALGNIETMNRVPVDPIIVDALEVSRGANANVFGLGNPSGTVNQVAASANLSRNKASTEFRYDSFGGRRASLDVNQMLIKGKLAIRGSAVLQKDEFDRKPSGVTTERYNGMIKWQPFKYTTLTGSVFYYHAYGNRPNSLPPRDNISYWLSQGRRTWDPVTGQIHNADGSLFGTVSGTSFGSSSFPYLPGSTTQRFDAFAYGYLGADRSQLFIDQGGLGYWTAAKGTTNTTDPSKNVVATRAYLQPAPGPGFTSNNTGKGSGQDPLLSTTPTISDKSIYDWSSINLSAPNRFWDKTTTINAAIDQIIIDSSKQTLAAQVAFMREDSERWTRNFIGIANDNGQSGQLTIDINERLLDGTVNPYFLRPYINVDKPRIAYQPATWDTARAQLAYRLDLTQEKSWLKWLGSHNFTSYAEYKHRVNRQYSWREGVTSAVSWLPSKIYRGFQANPSLSPSGSVNPANPYTLSSDEGRALQYAQNAYRYYVGDKITVNGVNVDYAPGDVSYGTYNYTWGTAGATPHVESFTLGQLAADKTSGQFNTDTIIRTWGSVLQNHFFGDRLISTFGIREDRVRTKFGVLGIPWTGTYTSGILNGTAYDGTLVNAYLNDDGMTFNYDLTDAWDTGTYGSFKTKGRTTNVQFMLRPLYNTKVANDLKASSNGFSRFLGDVLNGISVYTNRSSSFLPINPSQDIYKNLLPDTTGRDKSWGIGLNLMDGKLSIRFTRFDNIQKNAQNTDLSTMVGRALRLDMLAPVTAGSPTPFINLHDTMLHAVKYVTASTDTALRTQYAAYVQGASEDPEAVVARLTKLSQSDVDYYTIGKPGFAATVDTRSVGSEIEVNYNPTPHWTVSASVTDTKAINNNVANSLQSWLGERLPIWTTIVDPSISNADAAAENNPNKLWWLHSYATNVGNATTWTGAQAAPYASGAATAQSNYQSFIQVPFAVLRNLEGQSNPQVRRYAARLSTNYSLAGITENTWLKKMSVGGAVRWEDKGAIGFRALDSLTLDVNNPIYDKEHYYFDAFVSYKTKLWSDKIAATFRLNAKNIGQHGSLRPVGAFYTGQIHTYRIVDSQQFTLSAAFDF